MKPILGVDFGQARIGLAISDELQLLAHPFKTIAAGNDAIARIAEIARTKQVEAVVVGLPKTMSGQIGTAAGEVLSLIEKLRAVLPCPVIKWDERLTTVAAHRSLQEARKKTRETRSYVDQVAAQLILQGYLDQKQLAGAGKDEPAG